LTQVDLAIGEEAGYSHAERLFGAAG
jgi:hypothetical protein